MLILKSHFPEKNTQIKTKDVTILRENFNMLVIKIQTEEI